MRTLLRTIPREWQAAAADAVISLVAYLVTHLLLPYTGIPRNLPDTLWMLAMCVFILVTLYAFRVYQRIWSKTSGHSVIVLVGAVFIATIIGMIVEALFRPRLLSPNSILISNAFALVGIVAVRYRSRLVSGFRWRWRAVWRNEFPESPTRVLIIGAGESGQTLAWRLQHRSRDTRYHVVGFVDDDPQKQRKIIEGCSVLGTRKDIQRLVDEKHIDLIIMAIHKIKGADFRDMLERCESTQARIKVVPDLFALMSDVSHGAPLRDVQPEDLLGRTVISRHEAVDLAPVTRKTILITGAAGSIGSELSRQIMHYQPTHVLLLDNNESGLHDLQIELEAECPDITMTPILGDITQLSRLRELFARYQPQVVFHAAAYKHVPMLQFHPLEALRVNMLGTLNIARLACDFGVERFVLISTDKAVRPSSVMGASKRVCELMLHALAGSGEYRTLFTAVRFGNVLNSRGSVVPTFERQIARGGPVTVTDREMTRYFMSIPEAVNLIIHAASMTKGDDIFILQMGEVVRIVELAERMIRLHGLRPYQDIAIQFSGVRPGEKMHEELFSADEKPQSTLHPNIIKLNTWEDTFVADEFWRDLRGLLGDDRLDSTATRVLEQLRLLIESRPAPPKTGMPPVIKTSAQTDILETQH